jgi:hypothetical protein
MGKRSRKRGAPDEAPLSPAGTSRAARDEARQRRAEAAAGRREAGVRPGAGGSAPQRRRGRPSIDERPLPPWGKFPLDILLVLLALVLFALSFVVSGPRGAVMLTAALVLGSLAGLELSIREHFSGFRSHTTLLAGAAGFATMAILFFAGGKSDVTRALMIPAGGLVCLVAFWLLREAFKRRSGGLGFR